jgi:obg-like ATPase 1
MPPKKAAAPEKKTLLGRPGNNLKIGIVGLFAAHLGLMLCLTVFDLGLPNVGKSSFFNTLSKTGLCHMLCVDCSLAYPIIKILERLQTILMPP